MSTITKSMGGVDYGYLLITEDPTERPHSMLEHHRNELRSYTGKLVFHMPSQGEDSLLQGTMRNGVFDPNSLTHRASLEANWQVGDIAYCYDGWEDAHWSETLETEADDDNRITDDDYVDNGIVEVQIDHIDHTHTPPSIQATSDTGQRYQLDGSDLAPTREAAEAQWVSTRQQDVAQFAASVRDLGEPLTKEEEALFTPPSPSTEDDLAFSASIEELDKYCDATMTMV